MKDWVHVSNIVIAFLVPFLSVYAAQVLVRRDAKRQTARDILLKTSRDIQSFRHSFLDRHPEKLTTANADSETTARLARELVDCVTDLNGDCLILGLMFDKQADELGSSVRALASKADLLLGESQPPPLEVCQDGLNKEIVEISQKMRPLWESLDRIRLWFWKA